MHPHGPYALTGPQSVRSRPGGVNFGEESRQA